MAGKKFNKDIFNTMHEPIVVLGANLKVLFANDSFYDKFKLAPAETEQRPIYELGGGQWDMPELRRLLGEVLSGKSPHFGLEIMRAFRGIGMRAIRINARRFIGLFGRTEMIVLAIDDITEYKKEAMLQKDFDLLVNADEMARIGGWEVDLATREVMWSDETRRIHQWEDGYKPTLEEAFSFYAPESIPLLKEAVQKAVEKGEPYDLELQIIPAQTKKIIWVRVIGRAVRRDGKIVKLQGTLQDIDAPKRMEDALRMSEERYKSLFAGIKDAIFIADPETRMLVDCNRQAEALIGRTRDEILSMRLDQLHPEDVAGEIMEIFKRQAAGEDIRADSCILTKSGERIPVAIATTIIKIDGKKRVAGVFRDITERVKVMAALRHEKELAQAYLETAAVMMLALDTDGKIILINQKGCDVLGYEKDQIIGKDWFDNFIPASEKEEVRNVFFRLLHEEGGLFGYYENSIRTARDGERLIGWNNTTLRDDDGKITAILSSGEDITERKTEEEATKRSEERFRILFEFAPDAYFLCDLKGALLDGNIKSEDLIGYNREEVKGKNLMTLGILSPDQARRAATLLAKNIMGMPTGPDEFTLRRKSGESVSVEVLTHPIEIGDTTVVLGMARDITDRKKAEAALSSAQQHLIQAEKMAAIGRFSTGIAHEVKNPLGVILSGAEFLEAKLPRYDADVTSTIQKIKDASLRANFVLQGLLQFARPSEMNLARTNTTVIVRSVVEMMSTRAQYDNITIAAELDDLGIDVNVDKGQIQQVLFNIVKNSMEAIERSGTIRIKVYKASSPDVLGGKKACVIEIIDTGRGISDEAMARISEPFFTTKEEGKGTGLGIFVSKTIMENHKGKLLIDSIEGKGTRVRVVLPL